MSLQFILGGSGAGKSHYLYNRVIEESMLEEENRYLVLVPEQFTMETQKDFVTMHPRHGILNIDVLSFMRLAYRVLEETGKGKEPILEDIGKTMVLRRVLEERKDELVYFKSNIRKPGFVDEIKSMLSELYQYSIEEEELEHMIELAEKKPMLVAKLKDLLVIYRGFKTFLVDKYITAEEIMDALFDELENSRMVRDSVIVLDGFTGFTPSQYKVLGRLMALGRKIYVTVTIDEREDVTRIGEEHQLFHLSKTTIYKLRKMALDMGITVLDPIYPPRNNGELYRFRENKPLGALEKNLFRFPWKAYEESQESVHIYSLKNPKAEVRFVVGKMLSLIRREGYRYRDFAVVTGDMGSYGRIIERELGNDGIPCFIDDKRSIEENPLVVMITGVLEAAEQGMNYESVFYYLRAGLSSLEKEEIDLLDNYVLALGIRGLKRWEAPFARCMNGQGEVELEEINRIRERLMAEITPLYPILSGKKLRVREYAESLYEFIEKSKSFDRLMVYKMEFEEQGLWLKAKEYEQVYPLVMKVLEDLVELLGNEVMPIREIRDLLTTGFGKVKVGLIPAGIDQVVVGDIERTRLKNVKILFFLGVNDGIVPKAAGGGGILSDSERELLKEKQVELAPTRREKIYQEHFYLYLNLTKPEKSVYLTYSNVGNDGKAVKPSFLIGKMAQLFPLTTIVDDKAWMFDGESSYLTEEEKLEQIFGGDKGMEYLLEGLKSWGDSKKERMYWPAVYSWYVENREMDEKLSNDLIKYINGSCYQAEGSAITKAVANALYGTSMVGSVTRLEQYASCAAAHYFTYGLALKERQEFKINVPDMGNIFHNALELFSGKMEERRLDWSSLTDELRESLGEECVKQVTEEYGNTIFHSSKRNEYMIQRISRILKRTLWAVSRQLGAGVFVPQGYELSFSYMDHLDSVNIPLADNGNMRLTGRIDRMDVCEEAERLYVKVVDYKSGQKTFDVVDMYYGFQLQLVVYLGTVLEKNRRDHPDKQVIPAGVFYYTIDDPIVDKTDDLFLEEALLKELKVNGLVNEDEAVLKALDKNFQWENGLLPSVKSTVIPVETLKDGMLSKNSSVAKTEDFEHMISFVREKMKTLGNEIMEGMTDTNPYQLDNRTACDYCNFVGMCGFDKKLPGKEFRVLEKRTKEDVWREINGDNDVDRGSEEGN